VLLIDDDPLVLVSLERLLQAEYRVVTAASGQAALDLLRAGQRFDVVVCDVMMPDMTGVQFSAEMERQRPGSGTRLIFITGAPMLPEVEAFRAVTRGIWLEKPLEGDTLLASVRDLLDKVGLS
jgi:CheY-like chemotaxis protein